MRHVAVQPRRIAAATGEIPFPEMRQAFDYDCGPTAIRGVLAYYGTDASLDEIMEAAGTTEDGGTSLDGMLDALDAYGIPHESGRMTTAEVVDRVDRGIPVLVPLQAWPGDGGRDWQDGWDNGHWVVVVGHDDRGLIFEDPSEFRRTFLPIPEFERRWHDEDAAGRRFVHHGIAAGDGNSSFDPDESVVMGGRASLRTMAAELKKLSRALEAAVSVKELENVMEEVLLLIDEEGDPRRIVDLHRRISDMSDELGIDPLDTFVMEDRIRQRLRRERRISTRLASITFTVYTPPSPQPCYLCKGDDPNCRVCKGRGTVELADLVPDAPEMNLSNANAMAIMRLAGFPVDYGGGIDNRDIPRHLRSITRVLNDARARATEVREDVEDRGPVRVVDQEGVPTITRGPKVYDFGRDDEYLVLRLQKLAEILKYAMETGNDVGWG